MIKQVFSTALAAAAAAVLVGCGSTVKLDDVPVETRSPAVLASGASGSTASRTSGTTSPTTPQSQVATVDLSRAATPSDSAALGSLGRTVYFEFDSFVVKDEYRSMVEAHAKQLAANKARRMVLEGHGDERGGREYNLALGQKRAEAVAKSLVLLGAADAQLEAVSMGKERPTDPGHDEAAWAKNRRVELKDR